MLIFDPLSSFIPPNVELLLPDDLAASQDVARGPTPKLSDIAPAVRALTTRLTAPLLPEKAADESRLDNAVRESLGALGALKVPVQSLETAFAFATASIGAAFELPAASIAIKSLHFGLPHVHAHPPAFPNPLPSIGSLFLGGTQSVLINNHPAARAGDLGIAITCGSFTPFFKVTTGSSKVFFGPNRAARSLDLTTFCKASSSSKSWVDKLPDHDSTANIANAGVKSVAGMSKTMATDGAARRESDKAMAQSLAAESEGHALSAAVQAKQALVGAAVKVLSELVGKDGAAGPVFPGMLSVLGTNVLIGGFPTPPTLKFLVGLRKGLSASSVRFAAGVTAGVY
ncbi:MAG TPA: PAAR domain-containing protein, partial [Nannocystis sp.]